MRAALLLPTLWGLLAGFALADIAAQGDVFTTIWFSFGLLACPAAIAVIATTREPTAHRVWPWAIGPIPATFLGPLALLLLFVGVIRRDLREALSPRSSRAVAAKLQEGQSKAIETVHERRAWKAAPETRAQPLLPPPVPAAPAPRGAAAEATRRPQQRPKSLLALVAVLAGALVAFPVTAIGLILLEALGGVGFLTAHDLRVVDVIAGVASGAVVVLAAAQWAQAGGERRRRTRRLGWSLIAAVAVIVAIATAYFYGERSPNNVRPPTVRGAPHVEGLLSADPGVWNSPNRALSLDYQWQRCDGSCMDIEGATHRSYAPVPRDLGSRIRVSVYASFRSNDLRDLGTALIHSQETRPVTSW